MKGKHTRKWRWGPVSTECLPSGTALSGLWRKRGLRGSIETHKVTGSLVTLLHCERVCVILRKLCTWWWPVCPDVRNTSALVRICCRTCIWLSNGGVARVSLIDCVGKISIATMMSLIGQLPVIHGSPEHQYLEVNLKVQLGCQIDAEIQINDIQS